MQRIKNYGGLDLFRPAAAVLVIAIHTSPLASFTAGGDFFLTRILARLAVPFFFMLTGQFSTAPDRLMGFLKKMGLLYFFSSLLYLPLGIYAGHYDKLTPTGLLRMFFFDGTFYHLWYFPACVLGLLLVCLMARRFSARLLVFFSLFLYFIGLFGDSYYGIAKQVPVFRDFYEGLFTVSSYTRNGVFFAPCFLVMGMLMQKLALPSKKRTAVGFLLSFCAMTAEAFLLRHFGLQRHDSMYVFLPPAMFFLYRLLSAVSLPSRKALRSISLWVYLLHPLFIVIVRAAAKLLSLTAFLIDNSLLHFFAVTLLSFAAAVPLTYAFDKLRKKRRAVRLGSGTHTDTQDGDHAQLDYSTHADARAGDCTSCRRAWIELDPAALEHNVRYLQTLLPENCRLMPAVKANAYGHGAVPIAAALNRMGISAFCVACISEGIELRNAGISGEILILGYTHPSQFAALSQYKLTQTVVDYPYAQAMQQSGFKLHVHVAVDTGMHRLGIRCEDYESLVNVFRMSNLIIDGIFTHLAACDCMDEESRRFTEEQLTAFFQTVSALRADGYDCHGVHALSSYGILHYPDAAADYVRPGIALYGVPSDCKEDFPRLLPVLSLKARVATVRTLYAGEAAGYGMDFIAPDDRKIAVLSIGYADGLPRMLSDGIGHVLLNGYVAPILGRICMDQTLIDVSAIPSAAPGDVAVIIGKNGNCEITAPQLAEQCGTITNELLSRLGSRLEHIFL